MSDERLIAKIDEFIEFQKRPSIFLKPTLVMQDHKWCAWYGESIDNGIAGFGKTPTEAYHDFDVKFYDYIPKHETVNA